MLEQTNLCPGNYVYETLWRLDFSVHDNCNDFRNIKKMRWWLSRNCFENRDVVWLLIISSKLRALNLEQKLSNRWWEGGRWSFFSSVHKTRRSQNQSANFKWGISWNVLQKLASIEKRASPPMLTYVLFSIFSSPRDWSTNVIYQGPDFAAWDCNICACGFDERKRCRTWAFSDFCKILPANFRILA